jgi:magnesium transporter
MLISTPVYFLSPMSPSTLNIYLSTLSNKMNEVMKVLTIMASIFIPLTFIAGIYGMNFKLMPELEWKWGYPAIWVIIILIVVLMLIGFRRKKWL